MFSTCKESMCLFFKYREVELYYNLVFVEEANQSNALIKVTYNSIFFYNLILGLRSKVSFCNYSFFQKLVEKNERWNF